MSMLLMRNIELVVWISLTTARQAIVSDGYVYCIREKQYIDRYDYWAASLPCPCGTNISTFSAVDTQKQDRETEATETSQSVSDAANNRRLTQHQVTARCWRCRIAQSTWRCRGNQVSDDQIPLYQSVTHSCWKWKAYTRWDDILVKVFHSSM